MRIIAGEFRGRLLLPPTGQSTRPITDRVKQSLFDILTPLLPDARVYDCFAGTGSLGLEALSRGAAHATFFESDRSTLALLKQNINSLGLDACAAVIAEDIFRHMSRQPTAPPAHRAAVIFLDPPYRFLRDRPADLQHLAAQLASCHLASTGIVVFRHDAADTLALPPLILSDTRVYGGMAIEFLQPLPATG